LEGLMGVFRHSHQLGPNSRVLVNYCGLPRGINHLVQRSRTLH
jgi:hypothetical protein